MVDWVQVTHCWCKLWRCHSYTLLHCLLALTLIIVSDSFAGSACREHDGPPLWIGQLPLLFAFMLERWFLRTPFPSCTLIYGAIFNTLVLLQLSFIPVLIVHLNGKWTVFVLLFFSLYTGFITYVNIIKTQQLHTQSVVVNRWWLRLTCFCW